MSDLDQAGERFGTYPREAGAEQPFQRVRPVTYGGSDDRFDAQTLANVVPLGQGRIGDCHRIGGLLEPHAVAQPADVDVVAHACCVERSVRPCPQRLGDRCDRMLTAKPVPHRHRHACRPDQRLRICGGERSGECRGGVYPNRFRPVRGPDQQKGKQPLITAHRPRIHSTLPLPPVCRAGGQQQGDGIGPVPGGPDDLSPSVTRMPYLPQCGVKP